MISGLAEQLRRDEGVVDHAYQDSLGYWTIGVGHLIDARKGGSIPPQIIDALLEWDMQEKRKALLHAIPWAVALDDVRLGALLNMAFNLGVDGLMGFKNMLELVRQGNYNDAADHMLMSKWSTQVGPRATRLAQQMRSGQWT